MAEYLKYLDVDVHSGLYGMQDQELSNPQRHQLSNPDLELAGNDVDNLRFYALRLRQLEKSELELVKKEGTLSRPHIH